MKRIVVLSMVFVGSSFAAISDKKMVTMPYKPGKFPGAQYGQKTGIVLPSMPTEVIVPNDVISQVKSGMDTASAGVKTDFQNIQPVAQTVNKALTSAVQGSVVPAVGAAPVVTTAVTLDDVLTDALSVRDADTAVALMNKLSKVPAQDLEKGIQDFANSIMVKSGSGYELSLNFAGIDATGMIKQYMPMVKSSLKGLEWDNGIQMGLNAVIPGVADALLQGKSLSTEQMKQLREYATMVRDNKAALQKVRETLNINKAAYARLISSGVRGVMNFVEIAAKGTYTNEKYPAGFGDVVVKANALLKRCSQHVEKIISTTMETTLKAMDLAINFASTDISNDTVLVGAAKNLLNSTKQLQKTYGEQISTVFGTTVSATLMQDAQAFVQAFNAMQ